MGTYKRLSWNEEDVCCPFYISDNRAARSISCEGYDTGVDVLSRFRSLALRDRHMGRYCVGRFEDCPVYCCTYARKYSD